MVKKITERQNRIREALGRLYDQHPPHFREYVRRFEEDPTSRVFAPLAEAYRRMGRVDEAIGICKAGLGHHPDFHGGHVALAKCYIDKKQLSEALHELTLVVKAVPENLLAQRLSGDTHLMMGNRSLALDSYKMALLLSPSDTSLTEKVRQLENQIQEPQNVESFSELPQIDVSLEEAILSAEPVIEDSVIEEPVEEYVVPPIEQMEDEIPSDPQVTSEINALLGVSDGEIEDDSFKIEHVSAIFSDPEKEKRKEITTETLGDLYYSQEQFQRSLEIFEKLASRRQSAELNRKIILCREKLGVDRNSIDKNRKIETLRTLLKRNKELAKLNSSSSII